MGRSGQCLPPHSHALLPPILLMLQSMLRRCLDSDPAQRPAAKDLLLEIEALIAAGQRGSSAASEASATSQ